MEKDRRIFGWLMYDWANSAFITTVGVAVLPAYFAASVAKGGWVFMGTRFGATSLWGYTVGLAGLVVFLLAPFFGALADQADRKKLFLTVLCLLGSLLSFLLVFSGPGRVVYTLALFAGAQICFVGGNIFYDAFLPHLARKGDMDRISGKGFAYGYVGGGLQFALSLGLVAGHGFLGISQDLAARLAMAMAGLWWGGFGIMALSRLEETGPAPEKSALNQLPRLARESLARIADTTRRVRGNKPLLVFILAFLLYNDGVQTVISMSTIYGKQELGLSTAFLMLVLLLIQAIGVFGALAFARLAGRISARRALMLALVLWTATAVYAFFIDDPWEFLLLGAVVGLILGGSQALGRSIYAGMIPPRASAEYFAYFSVVNRFSCILGPLLFGFITQTTGSARGAIISLVFFFVTGLFLLWRLGAIQARQG